MGRNKNISDKVKDKICDQQGKEKLETEIYTVYELDYQKGCKDDEMQDIILMRFTAIKNLYFDWCYMRKLKPNLNEGWFSSKKFTKYMKEIGYYEQHFDYIAWLTNVKVIE